MLRPQLLVTFKPVRIVLHRIALTVALGTVKCNQRRQSKGQTCWQFAGRLLPCQQLRQNAGAVLGHPVQGNRQQLMLNVRISETPRYGTGEGVQLVARQIQDRNNLLINSLLYERAKFRVVHGFPYRIQAGLKSDRNQRRVRAVEDRHLTLFIRFDIVNNQDVEWVFIQAQFSCK